VSCIEAFDYGQTCSNASTDNQCKYLSQETRCFGPAPFKCQCHAGKYLNKDNYKCESLLEINETCLQVDSCKYGNCIGSPPKCQCSIMQYFDQISGQCKDQLNVSSSSLLPTSYTSSTISSSTSKSIYFVNFVFQHF
jgi:hypothetical protein